MTVRLDCEDIEHPAYATAPDQTWCCAACRAKYDGGQRFFERLSERGAHRSLVDALSDTLGLCPRHGAWAASADYIRPDGHVWRDIAAKVRLRLQESAIREERIERRLFAAATACPACDAEERAVGRYFAARTRELTDDPTAAVSALSDLCEPHAGRLAGALSCDIGLPWLKRSHGHIGALCDEVESEAKHDRAPAAQQLLRGLAGDAQPGWLPRDPAKAAAIHSLLESPRQCSLCALAHQLKYRWLERLRGVIHIPQAQWLLFPLCPQHLWNASGDTQVLRATLGFVARKCLEREQREIERLEKLLAAEIPGGDAGAAFAAPENAPPHCPACEHLLIGSEFALGQLLDALDEAAHRQSYSRGYGLCMKHFAQAYVVAPAGAIRDTLLHTQRARLAQCEHDELAAAGRFTGAADVLENE